MQKLITLFLSCLTAISLSAQDDMNLVSSKCSEIVNKYLSSKTWLERSKYIIQRPNTLEMMEKRYDERNFELELLDSTSWVFNAKRSFENNNDPWLKVKGVNNYFRKKLTIKFGNNQSNTTTFLIKNTNNSLSIDWEASVGVSEASMDAFDTRKKKEYTMMRVFMKIEDNSFNKNDLQDYFFVRINQDGDAVSKEAVVFKDSENGKKLFDILADGQWHTKVIWIKYFDCLNKDQNSFNKTVNNIRLIGYINSIDNDNWIIEPDASGKDSKIQLEDPNLSNEIKKYENYLKADALITNPPLKIKTLNAARVEYYEKQVVLYGYLSIDSYYNYGYRDSEITHYSFDLNDKEFGSVQVYMRKVISKNLFDQLTTKKALAVKVTAIPYKIKQESNFGDVLLEGLSVEVIE